VEELDLGNNHLGDAGAKWMSKALKENTTLRRLCLAGNDIGENGAWWIADALAVNGDLRSLDLGSNAIGDAVRGAVQAECSWRPIACENRLVFQTL
jgi:Ran GTPase-activating protein (RanGAP) involved in mRNA processing and transport